MFHGSSAMSFLSFGMPKHVSVVSPQPIECDFHGGAGAENTG
jgi:hypothetical protein